MNAAFATTPTIVRGPASSTSTRRPIGSLAGEIAPRHGVVDDDYGRGFVIPQPAPAAACRGRARRASPADVDVIKVDARAICSSDVAGGPPSTFSTLIESPCVESDTRANAGHRPQPVEEARGVGLALRGVLVARSRELDVEDEHAIGMEGGRVGVQAPEALEQQPGSREQHEREGNLGAGQPERQARTPRRGRLPSGFAQRVGRARGPERHERTAREQTGGRDANGGREHQHPRVDRRFRETRDRVRHQRDHGADAPPCEDESRAGAERREHQALGSELTREPRARRPERGANRHFASPPRRSSEQKAGNVGADDQQDERHGQEQHDETSPRAADELLRERGQDQLRRVPAGVPDWPARRRRAARRSRLAPARGSRPAADARRRSGAASEGRSIGRASRRTRRSAGVRAARATVESGSGNRARARRQSAPSARPR